MEALKKDFFNAWEDEIAAYQDVALILTEQKHALMRWDIKSFNSVSQQAALHIAKAHKATNERQTLMEALLVLDSKNLDSWNLRNIDETFDIDEEKRKAQIFFKVFSHTLKTIDALSHENKELIRTGLELVGDNLEMIADIIDHDRVYSRIGVVETKRSALLLNKRV